MRTLQEAEALMARFEAVGVAASLLEGERDFFHETQELPEELMELAPEGLFPFPDKPSGGLWFSRGQVQDSAVVSEWRHFLAEGMGLPQDELALYKTYRPLFKAHSVALTLTEENWVHLPRLWDANAESWTPFSHDFSALFTEKGRTQRVPWCKLMEEGVDAVYVDGRRTWGHFMGYDVNSLVLLAPRALKGWEPVESGNL